MAVDTQGLYIPVASSTTGIWNVQPPVSFSFWAKMNAVAAAPYKGPWYFGNNSGYMVLFDTSGAVMYVRDSAGPAWRTCVTTYPTVSQWNHWAGTIAVNSIKFYKNGAQVGSTGTTLTGINWVDAANFALGNYNNGKLDCSLAELGIYNKVLTADELLFLSSSFSRASLHIESVKAYWPMDDLSVGLSTAGVGLKDYGPGGLNFPAAASGLGEEFTLSHMGAAV